MPGPGFFPENERDSFDESARSKVRWSGPWVPTPDPAGNMLLGGSRKAMEMMRSPPPNSLPVRRKKGTPAQRQLSISQRRATNVSVSESGATPGMSRYPAYWPLTTWVTSSGRIDRKTLFFSSLMAGDSGGGG